MISMPHCTRIIVRAPNWVGDAVMATPFFTSLRQTLPDAKITCLCRPMVADIFRYHPDVDGIVELDETQGRSGWRAARLNAEQLKKYEFNVAVSLPNSFSSALIFFLAGIPVRLGYRGDWRRGMLTRSVQFPRKGQRPHRVECYLQLLQLVSADPVIDRELRLAPGEDAAKQVSDVVDMHNLGQTSYIAIAAGAAQPNKMWMASRFSGLVQALDSHGLRAVLVGSPAEQELSEQVAAQAAIDGTVNLAGAGSLLFTAEIIRRASVFVGNDSGLAHVAAGVGTKSVILSGPGDPTEVAPYSDKATTIAKELFCKPCYKNYCWRKDKPLECLKLIEVEEVCASVVANLKS